MFRLITSLWTARFNSEQDLRNQVRQKINQLHLLMSQMTLVIGVAYTITNLLMGSYTEAIVTSTTIPLFLVCNYGLYQRGYALASKILLASGVSVLVCTLALINGIETGILIFLMPVIVGCLIIFE